MVLDWFSRHSPRYVSEGNLESSINRTVHRASFSNQIPDSEFKGVPVCSCDLTYMLWVVNVCYCAEF